MYYSNIFENWNMSFVTFLHVEQRIGKIAGGEK